MIVPMGTPTTRSALRLVAAALASALALAGCGGSPLQSVGHRSSDWINEPTVPTTVTVATTIPTKVDASTLIWVNDSIVTESLDDREALLEEVFARRQGDRFIQASRFEIAIALPEVAFLSEAPAGARFVTSQLVFDNDGTVAADPSAAFGIWSAEPYTRSRSVAQMAVLRVSTDPETASEVASSDDTSCARFAERTTEQCEMIPVGERPTWLLSTTGGATVVWFEGPYRYELFGRSFVPVDILAEISSTMVPLATIGSGSS